MINERKLTPVELKKREDIIMNMKGNKRDLVKKYGKDAEAVMYGRATNMAKKQTENMRDSKLTELIKDALTNPKKADLNKDGKLSSYETRGDELDRKSTQVSKDKKELENLMRNDPYTNEFDPDSTSYYKKSIDEDYDGQDLESGAYGDPVDAELDVTTAAPDHTEEEAELGLEEDIRGKKLSDLQNMGTADINLWHVSKLVDAGLLRNEEVGEALEALDPSRKLDEDIDIGHEDNEPGMLQGDLYQIGKAAMELYELLDDMEGEGEVDLPSWWQAKIYKAKEAIVGAAEYLEFELKEPAIDAVVDRVAPLDIEVDPLGETVEDEITSVDDMTENQKIASKLAKRLYVTENVSENEYFSYLNDLRDSGQTNMFGAGEYLERDFNLDKREAREILAKWMKSFDELDEGLPKGFWDKKIDAEDEDQDGKVDESYATLVNKIEKSGKSEKAAKAIAGAVASYKAKGGGKGPTSKQK